MVGRAGTFWRSWKQPLHVCGPLSSSRPSTMLHSRCSNSGPESHGVETCTLNLQHHPSGTRNCVVSTYTSLSQEHTIQSGIQISLPTIPSYSHISDCSYLCPVPSFYPNPVGSSAAEMIFLCRSVYRLCSSRILWSVVAGRCLV